jgi:hypothetical protein
VPRADDEYSGNGRCERRGDARAGYDPQMPTAPPGRGGARQRGQGKKGLATLVHGELGPLWRFRLLGQFRFHELGQHPQRLGVGVEPGGQYPSVSAHFTQQKSDAEQRCDESSS